MSEGLDGFGPALVDAAGVLTALPRRRAEVEEARRLVSRLRESHPQVRVDLAVDLEPGSIDADYDLLLEHPAGGTVALSYRPDRGNPWLVDYAEHWAANYVLSVGDDVRLTVQQALTALEIHADESPGLIDRLIDGALLERTLELEPHEVTLEETQAAVDSFRAARGLRSAAATRAWLTRRGWSVELFQRLIENGVRASRLRDRLTAGFEPYFNAHREEFELVRVFRIETASADAARDLAALAAHHGLPTAVAGAAGTADDSLTGSLATVRAHQLPPELAGVPPRCVVGPVASGSRFWLAEVLSRHPATELDAATRSAVRDLLFRQWLDVQRVGRPVRWHWL